MLGAEVARIGVGVKGGEPVANVIPAARPFVIPLSHTGAGMTLRRAEWLMRLFEKIVGPAAFRTVSPSRCDD
ncbi:protein of unknown function [Bradyrhizobium vignae]|uniref:Uncharacterized protein n=1 Tax=Bradyrhizobium vignae TaxID=1549949 RepID=A0A2U3PSX3_9BRAD|nr:protein of unknown function [Bradyrhizobium vignae]